MNAKSSETNSNAMVCPKCGGSHIKLIAEHRDDPGSFLGQVHEPMLTRVYACQCGTAFSKTSPCSPAVTK